MKYLKTFEEQKNNINIDDYVVIILPFNHFKDLSDFFNNNIGKVINKMIDIAIVSFDNVPENIKEYMILYTSDDDISKNKYSYPMKYEYLRLATPEEIEHQKLKNSANKYNL